VIVYGLLIFYFPALVAIRGTTADYFDSRVSGFGLSFADRVGESSVISLSCRAYSRLWVSC
jgi:hypothetical protein